MIGDKKKTPDSTVKTIISDVRKPYTKPLLEPLGDLRTLTLGGSPTNVGDFSGNFNTAPFP